MKQTTGTTFTYLIFFLSPLQKYYYSSLLLCIALFFTTLFLSSLLFIFLSIFFRFRKLEHPRLCTARHRYAPRCCGGHWLVWVSGREFTSVAGQNGWYGLRIISKLCLNRRWREVLDDCSPCLPNWKPPNWKANPYACNYSLLALICSIFPYAISCINLNWIEKKNDYIVNLQRESKTSKR